MTLVLLALLALLAPVDTKAPAPPAPPIDDGLSAFCPPNRVAICTSFCAHNPSATCFVDCCLR